jgi:diguanylate cyclase (GGDEF)-like protein
MSTPGAVRRAAYRVRALPSRLVLPAVSTALAFVLVALAGSALGPAAALLALPAAFAAVLVRLRIDARHKGLELLTQQDALTGLGNRRLLKERLDYEIIRHRRHQRRFTVLALDLDGFKSVNDRFGHAAGDEILREVARAMERTVRTQDTLVRLGGDEFCVLAPETTWQAADLLTKRLRDAVRGAVSGLEMLDVSIGYAVFPDEGWTPEQLLERADEAEGEVKRKSRAARRNLRAA